MSFLWITIPATLVLALASLGLAVAVGIPLGVATSLRAAAAVDVAVLVVSLVLLSVPVFWLGMLLLDVFAARLRWLPPVAIRPHVVAQPRGRGLPHNV